MSAVGTSSSNQPNLTELKVSFRYEVGILVSQSKLYLDHGEELAHDRDLYPAADALLDALLVRLRSLDAFLNNDEKWSRDAVARHVVQQWQGIPTLDEHQRDDISARIAHLTYDRPPTHEWPIGDMIRRTLEAVKAFLEASGPLPDWRERLNEVGELLSTWGDRNRIWTAPDAHAHRR